MKKLVISLIAVLVIVTFIATLLNTSYGYDWGTAMSNVESATDKSDGAKAATNITGALLDIFRIAAAGIALIMIAVVAIKYMSAAPEGKAEIKKTATVYIVGAVVLFASSGILTIIKTFAEKNIGAGGNGGGNG